MDICEEVVELASKLSISFSVIKCSANVAVDVLTKRGVGRYKLVKNFLLILLSLRFGGLLYPFPFLFDFHL